MNTTIAEKDIITVIIYTFVAFLLMALVLIVFYYFSKKKLMREAIERKDLEIRHQKDLTRSVILTQEKERKRIAQDLHDAISSKLNIVSLNSHLLMAPNLLETEIAEITGNIIMLTSKALESSRRIAHGLLPPVLEQFGLKAAIEELCLEFETNKKLNIDFETDFIFDFPDTIELQIFRILQELMNNSIRHGEATQITVRFQKKNEIRSCLYTDNGKGFNIHDYENKKGLGMRNIESRIEMLGGKLKFESATNQGVNVSFIF